MNRKTGTNRCLVCCLLLSAVLFLGIVQWSFLPLLVQGAPPPGRTLLEDSSSHTSKFAAPFKCLFGDSLEPNVSLLRISAPALTLTFFQRMEEPIPSWQDLFSSRRQHRAPPTA
jgi:hypothetical protein